MMQRALLNFRMPALTCVGLLIFLSVFIMALFWVFRKGSSEFYGKMEQLPFKGDH